MRVSMPHGARRFWLFQHGGRRRLSKGESTLLDEVLGSGELLLHVDDVLLGLAEVVLGLE